MKQVLFFAALICGAQALVKHVLAGRPTSIKMKTAGKQNETNYITIRYKHQKKFEAIFEHRVQKDRLPSIHRTEGEGSGFSQRVNVKYGASTVLYIDSVQASDDNTYVIETNGRIYSLRLIVSTRFTGPMITSKPQAQVMGTVFVSEGFRLQLSCKVEGAIDYPINILWKFQRIEGQNVDFKNNSIILENISSKVSGNLYVCHARSIFRQVEYNFIQVEVVTRRDFVEANKEFRDLLNAGGLLLLGYLVAVIIIILLSIVALCMCNVTKNKQ